MSSFYVYILQSECNKTYYIGCTNNIEKRLEAHNSGRVKSTKPHVPWKQMYTEKFETRKKALFREKQIKNWKSRKAIEKLLAPSSNG